MIIHDLKNPLTIILILSEPAALNIIPKVNRIKKTANQMKCGFNIAINEL